MQKLLFLIFLAVALATACSERSVDMPPTGPSPVPAPAPTPVSAFAFPEPHTFISIGDVVVRHVSEDGSDNTGCVDLPGWGCHYFRFTALDNGDLDIFLKWVLETQPVQPLDLSLTDSGGRTSWSEASGLHTVVTAGSTYQITVWYTSPGVEFELRSSMQPQ